jgi:hypothetical protein
MVKDLLSIDVLAAGGRRLDGAQAKSGDRTAGTDPGLRFAPSGLRISSPPSPRHHDIMPLFCPTRQTLFGIAEMHSRTAASTLHGVVFDIFV